MTLQFDPKSVMAGATAVAQPDAHPVGGLSYREHLKRGLDILLVMLAAPVALPLVALIALIVACDGGPAFYSQDRLGRGGRRFRMWKLRSMVVDADAALAAHLDGNPTARAEWVRNQKLANDPRITRLGQLIRRTSLDELPQLWNVLTGDMSLVGPRPMLPEQRVLYPGHTYFRLRPGLTGNWQVSDRNATTFAARADFDLTYDRALSLLTDLTIIAATVGVVLRATGR
ncbi:Sugar transferase involved in LPS biosynthesis (colanic, teichoic acid) [Jannaschia faecimaris]|uniref:Sugar transferase involved in LPS biosynthesis (Colanic, teichoic acid) n=1 Tax=Jannaschia faecimaris TaxID=1244108 RepID=A0A1H3IZ39_9RHOB|nr:sugar transferase [Jannaschia faecimaris]SDY32990.1 Sugar transferase involved in LPS biosynthesis (colanic, teichoic acid) [Jannaschia faecimaris]